MPEGLKNKISLSMNPHMDQWSHDTNSATRTALEKAAAAPVPVRHQSDTCHQEHKTAPKNNNDAALRKATKQ